MKPARTFSEGLKLDKLPKSSFYNWGKGKQLPMDVICPSEHHQTSEVVRIYFRHLTSSLFPEHRTRERKKVNSWKHIIPSFLFSVQVLKLGGGGLAPLLNTCIWCHPGKCGSRQCKKPTCGHNAAHTLPIAHPDLQTNQMSRDKSSSPHA